MEPPARKRICLGLNIPVPAENVRQSRADRRRNAVCVSLNAAAATVDNWAVKHSPPLERGGMEENFFKMVQKAWTVSPRVFLGVRTGELKDRGMRRVGKVLKMTARAVGCDSTDYVFPLIDRTKCRPDLKAATCHKERVVPVWMMIFLLRSVPGQFWKYNDRFRIMFDLLDELEEGQSDARLGILEDVPGLVRESVVLAARKGDRLLDVYETGAMRAAADMPTLQAELKTLRCQMIDFRDRVEALETKASEGGGSRTE